MTRHFTTKPMSRLAAPRHFRRGTSMLDLLVSLTLLVTLISVATPLVVRHGRLLKSHRDYRLALEELSNQLDRLSAVPAQQLPDVVKQLAPSAFAAERLSGARLTGELKPAEIGTRVTLKLSWREPGRHDAPVSLVAWVIPAAQQSGNQPTGAQP